MIIEIITGTIIPEPEPNTSIVFLAYYNPNPPFLRGNGKFNFVCGSCPTLLLERVDLVQVKNFIFQCPKCKEFNTTDYQARWL